MVNPAPTRQIEGDPFELARSSCRHAAQLARDVFIDEPRLRAFAAQLDTDAVSGVMQGHMGENCDTLPADFEDVGQYEGHDFLLTVAARFLAVFA